MKNFNSIGVFFLGILLMHSYACKKRNDLIISMYTDTIFVNDEVRFDVNVDFKVKDEEWKILETNAIISNVSAGKYKFPAKGTYTIQYSAKNGFKEIVAQREVHVYPAPGVIKNYWTGPSNARGDIFLRVKGTRYDGKPFADSIFYEKKYGVNNIGTDCADVIDPEVFIKVPGGRYKCYLKYKYFNINNIWVEHSDSVFIDGNCEAFNY
jgi:hypothetical protein